MRNLNILLFLILLGSLPGQEIDLTGIVSASGGGPIENAELALLGAGLKDTTFYIWITPDTKGNSTLQLLPQFFSNGYRIGIQNSGANDQLENNVVNWTDTFGTASDGLFHLFEVYIKLDTDSTDGVGRAWIDGTRVLNKTDVDYSGGSAASRAGIKFMDFQSNQSNPNNGQAMYSDYDDIEIWNTTPPATDSFGDPWIGPLNGYSGG